MLKIALTFSWLAAVAYNGGFNPALLLVALGGLLLSVLFMPAAPAAVVAPHWRYSGFDAITAALFMASMAGYVFSILPGVSIDPALSVAALPITYWLSRHKLWKDIQWHALLLPLHIAGMALAVVAISEFFILRSRPFVTFGDANALAAFFNALFFPLYMVTFADWSSGKSLQLQRPRLAGLVLLLFAITATTSLGAQLCLMGGLGLSVIVFGVRRKRSWAALLMVAAVFAPSYLFANHYADGREAAGRLSSLDQQQSFTDRVDMVHSTLEMYGDRPWFGSGIGTYKTLYPSYRRTTELTSSGDLAHNDYVQFLAEGGPLLLACLLGLLAMTSLRIWQLWRRTAAAPTEEREVIVTAGYSIAVLCLLLHAVMNFIVYVLPLAMVIGLYLARQENSMAKGRSAVIDAQLASPLLKVGVGFFAFFLLISLGPRAVFAGVTNGDCKTRACEALRSSGTQIPTLANFLAAAQPTWLWSRDYIVQRLLQQAESAHEPGTRLQLQSAATHELIQIIEDAPAVHFPYARLAELLDDDPALSAVVPKQIPTSPALLYQMALARRPHDQTVRLRLARALDKEGQSRKAFDLVNIDGMRWWKTALISDSERIAMLRYMIPRAIGFGLCADARGMAGSLGIFVPDSALAKSASQIAADSGEVAGCGLTEPLPPE